MVYEELRAKIESRSARAGVIGLGYVGLPLALAYVDAGYEVVGYDVDPAKIEELRAGRSYLGDVASARVAAAVEAGRFEATADPARLAAADVVAICVPTPLTPENEPDLSFLESTAETLASQLRPGQLVIVESTVYPGATREVVLPLLERGGLRAGADFWLAFSPERVDPGNPAYPLAEIPTVVGGTDDAATELAAAFYEPVVREVVKVSSAETAEMSKLLENTYRAVNIALVNELKIICDRLGLDVFEVIAAAATKPYGFQEFRPGPGVGGHCIPLDPYYLAWRAKQVGHESRFVELAGRVNAAMPAYVVARLREALTARGREVDGAQVLILGVTYKANVDDLREAPALAVIDLLLREGAAVTYHDPYAPALPKTRKYDFGLTSVPLAAETLRAVDAVVIVSDHTSVDYDAVFREASLVVDTRGVARRLGYAGDNVVTA
ncbi:MAG: nucleotide sugar dehydrogenase [Candidatus Coatesbacteria bacterium]|nr:MAG: nucleotide sugar dehydrogenase [Candidatus Coatesbacteria bacterium]